VQFIHSFVPRIYVLPPQETYSEVLIEVLRTLKIIWLHYPEVAQIQPNHVKRIWSQWSPNHG